MLYFILIRNIKSVGFNIIPHIIKTVPNCLERLIFCKNCYKKDEEGGLKTFKSKKDLRSFVNL